MRGTESAFVAFYTRFETPPHVTAWGKSCADDLIIVAQLNVTLEHDVVTLICNEVVELLVTSLRIPVQFGPLSPLSFPSLSALALKTLVA